MRASNVVAALAAMLGLGGGPIVEGAPGAVGVAAGGAAATAVVGGTARAQPEDPAPAPRPDPGLASQLDRIVLDHGLGQFWGAVVVARNGEVLFTRGYGLADERLEPINRDSLFDIGSIAKQFTAATVLALEAQGKLAVTDPVGKYYDGLGESGSRVTLHHLLTHTSGMRDERAIQPLGFSDRDEAVRRAMKSVRPDDIGAEFEYSNAGYVVLAAVIEKATGQKYEEVVRAAIFAPAGLTSTGFLDGEGLDRAHRTARVVGGPAGRRMSLFASPVGEPWAWGLRGAGGVLTTVDDLVRWDRALEGDAVLTPAAKEKLFKVEKGGYACGWFIQRTPAGTKVHHSGGTRGFRAQLARYVGPGVVIAVLTNDAWDPVGLEQKLAAAVIPQQSEGIDATLTLKGLALNRYRGAEIDKGLAWSVGQEGGRIALSLAGPSGPVARLLTDPATAAAIAGSLEDSAKNGDKGGLAAMIGTMPYEFAADGVLELPKGLRWRILPMYSGIGEGGERIQDKRATLILVDEDRGFWPLIVKMDSAAAAGLAASIRSALE